MRIGRLPEVELYLRIRAAVRRSPQGAFRRFRWSISLLSRSLVAGAVMSHMACASPAPPVAGEGTGPRPDLRGASVMVFPIQAIRGLPGMVDAELVFALTARGEEVDWMVPDELREIVRRSPGLDVPLEGLPVGVFLRTVVDRIGDPIYGVLRRLTALTDVTIAVIPVIARYRPGPSPQDGAAEIAVAVLNARTGRVIWYGVIEGTRGPADDPAVVASVMDELAKVLTGG